ncbi:conserved hypothetical protein [Histoplasma capsulatum G186AR]|uniref:TM7S3/TM198-like domain-containing protein n=2 Tax=Ajellomyces capsulatus TaxID=5037 RepID=C0NDX2_AJECG|nr:uncharacterized protein HCBG_02065 [Histoplasma capsulatum G186AR]EEH10420.1 conserved hypothetical protein [Histoplasma capsulatum G186AR]
MRASFICIILYSISLTGPACVGGIQIFARQNVDALEPTKITPTVTLSPTDAATNSSPGTQSTSKPDPTATSKSGNDTTSTESPRPTDLSFLNGESFQFKIQIFFSVGFSSALAVTILIIYLMNPPISDAVQGAFVVAATATGAVFGGISLAFQDVSEGFGCLLGGFSLRLNENVFPSNISTYPITRGIRAELSGIIAIFLMGLVSQAKVWKMIKDRRQRETSLVDEEQKKHDQVEEEIAKNLEEDTNRERAHWESVYGDQQRPQNDSGIEIGREEGHERFSGTSVNRTSENRIYEMDALRMPGGDARNSHKSRESVQPITAAAAAMPAQSDTPPSNNPSSGDAQDTKPSIAPGHQPGLHELPGDTEMPGSANTAINSSRANPFEVRMDDECSSAAASLAESDYMACVRNDRDPAFGQPIHGRIVESNCTDDGGDGLTFVNDTRSISSSVEVEANEEHDYNMRPASQMESGTRCSPSSIYSGSQGAAGPTAVTEPDSSAVGKANCNGESVKDHDPTPMIETRWAESNGSEQTPILPDRINGCETEYALADDHAFPGPEISSKKTPDQDGKLAELAEAATTHSPGLADATGGSTASDQQISGKHDKPSDVSESLSSSIPVANRLSKVQSVLLPRVQLTSESVDNIPSHTSRVVLSHRTNEWAKHISDAGPPEVMEMDDLQQDIKTETDEPVAPVLVSELQQTAASTLSSRELDIDNSAVPRSQHGADPRLIRSSLRKSYIGVQTASDTPSSPPGRSPNSTNSSQTPPIYPLHRSGSNSTLGVAAQVETNRARPTSSISSTYKPASGILESNESHDRAPSFRGHRMSSPPLLAQRESAIRNRSLLLPSNISSATVNHFSKSQSRLSLNIPQTQHRSASPYPTKNNISVESTDDIPLSVRRELIQRSNNFQNQSQTQPSLHRPASVCSFPSLDNMSLVTARRQYEDHSQVQDSLQVREAKFARWRESVRNENIIKHFPDAAVETRWADLVKEHQWSQLGKQKEAIRTSYRNSAIEQAMRKGDMLSMHNEALRRMQASANKHASGTHSPAS